MNTSHLSTASFISIDLKDPSPEILLLMALIVQAASDIQRGNKHAPSARSFFRGDTFEDVADLMGLTRRFREMCQSL